MILQSEIINIYNTLAEIYENKMIMVFKSEIDFILNLIKYLDKYYRLYWLDQLQSYD